MRKMLFALLFVLPAAIALTAQSKPPITRADYGQWETLSAGGGRGGGFTPDGSWLAYGITRTNRSNELRLVKLADDTTKTIPFGAQPTFSSDSRWAAYSIGHSEADQERLRTANRPIQNALGILNLSTGTMTTVDGIESFAFSGDGAYLAMRRYAPAPPAAAGGGAAGATPPAGGGRGGRGNNGDDTPPVGTTLTVRHLASGRDTTFGNVSEFDWQDGDRSHLLAMTISADGRVGNGVQIFDPVTTNLRVLDSTSASYTQLAWRAAPSASLGAGAADLAVMCAKTDDTHDGPTYAILEWSGLGGREQMHTFDPTADASFPGGMHTVPYRAPSWSEDGETMFVGIAKWDDKPPAPARGGAGGRGSASTTAAAASADEDEPASVDIWHWTDVDVMAKQKLSAAQDRRRNLLAAWHLDTGAFVPIGKSLTEQVTPIRHTNEALVAEWSAYAMDRSIGRPAADMYLADLTTGARTKIKDNINDRLAQVSPNGKYLLYLQSDQYWLVNLATHGAPVNLTKSIPTSFIDKESDETIAQKPPFGVAGWAKDDSAVLLYDKYDIWQIATEGGKSARLTNGAADEVRHRYVRTNPEEDGIDLSKPLYVSLFGLWSKKSGYGLVSAAQPGVVTRAVWLDQSVGGLSRAKNADVFAYTTQDFDDSPDLYVTTSALTSGKPVTRTNAFQQNFAWGKSELIEYKTDRGQRLQGALYYPAGYEAGKTYPMIVYLYEKLSDNVHRYVAPSDRDYYNTSVFTSQGYFVLQPDIVFQAREPGLSVVNCVTPAVKRVVQMGIVDPKRVGVVGHSWGGFDTAFLATHTSGVFAAAVAGAPITDLVSNYGNHHWSSGIAETDHIETGQQRMEVPLYEDLQDYISNSAVFNVQNMTVPLLLEAGDADGTVFWHQSVELYNIARRAQKDVVMLVYNGEDHGLRQKKNQVDYQHRILEWFGHYLKDAPAAEWITHGESFLARADEVKKESIRK